MEEALWTELTLQALTKWELCAGAEEGSSREAREEAGRRGAGPSGGQSQAITPVPRPPGPHLKGQGTMASNHEWSPFVSLSPSLES